MARLVFRPGAVPRFANNLAKRDVRETSKEVQDLARMYAPGGSYSTGRLKRSIRWNYKYQFRGGVATRVGSNLIYANSVHGGQPARIIVPKRASHLNFYWRRLGRRVQLARVNHPGTKANPYLTDALVVVGTRRGYRVVVF